MTSEKPTEILAEIIKLAHTLPTDPIEYTFLSGPKRRAIRAELENVVLRLNSVAQSLDQVRQPKHVFDPTSPKVIGEMVAHTLLLQDKESLADVVKQPFYGAGVYAIYYHGSFDCYSEISGKDHPIYVGKADPDALHALTPQEQGARLFTRLKDHNRSLGSAENLNLADFGCRYLVVRSAWVETAEDLLIDWFKPVWNNELKVCYGFGKHGDSAGTRANERSPWDTLHPGRLWAKSDENTPNKKNVAQIRAAIAEHFKTISTEKVALVDTLTPAERSERMSRVRSRGNHATELRLVSLFRTHHITGWRRGTKIMGRPDFVFNGSKVAIFVDGCFWHGCLRHGRIPKTRVAFWKAKIARNIQRDREVRRNLRKHGWRVLRVWEHDLARKNQARLARRLLAFINR